MGKQWWQCGNGGSDVFFWEKFCVSYRGGGGVFRGEFWAGRR